LFTVVVAARPVRFAPPLLAAAWPLRLLVLDWFVAAVVFPAGPEPLVPPPAALVEVEVAEFVWEPLMPTPAAAPLLPLALPLLFTDVCAELFEVLPVDPALLAPPVLAAPALLVETLVLVLLPVVLTLPLVPEAFEDV
jgi:hypothetical protein